MAEVKWIKITTDIFDDEKILLVESLPDAYAIITVWFKLLCLAGKQNNSGVFMMSNKIAYTDKMLATIFRMKEATVTMALQTFEQFGMIELVDGVITIPNWDKHQSLDAYEKKKKRDKLYQQKRRANQRALIQKSSDKSSDIVVSEKEREEEKEKEREKEEDVAVATGKTDSDTDTDTDSENEIDPESVLQAFRYGNIHLTDYQIGDLIDKMGGNYKTFDVYVDRLSEWKADKGATFTNDYEMILKWYKKDAKIAN